MLGPFTFTFTLKSEEFENFEKVYVRNSPWWTLVMNVAFKFSSDGEQAGISRCAAWGEAKRQGW